MSALSDALDSTPRELVSLARRVLASPHWRWLPTRDLDMMAPLSRLNSLLGATPGDIDAARLGWLAGQHRRRADDRRLGATVDALEAAP